MREKGDTNVVYMAGGGRNVANVITEMRKSLCFFPAAAASCTP